MNPVHVGVWAYTARGHGGQRRKEGRKGNAEEYRGTGGEMKLLLKGFQSVFHKDLELSWWESVREERAVLCCLWNNFFFYNIPLFLSA